MKTLRCTVCGQLFDRKPNYPPAKTCGPDCLSVLRIGKRHGVKYNVTEAIDKKIKAVYENGTGNGELRELADNLKWPRGILYLHAKKMGYVKRAYIGHDWKAWSQEEKDLVEKTGHYSVIQVRRKLQKLGYNRTDAAIHRMRAITRAVHNRAGMSCNELSICMGLDNRSIRQLIDSGRIKAKRLIGYEGPTAAYHILPEDIKRYILDNLPAVDFTKIDKYWLVDLLTEGKGIY